MRDNTQIKFDNDVLYTCCHLIIARRTHREYVWINGNAYSTGRFVQT